VGHGPAGAASATYRPDVVAALGFRWAVLARRPGNGWLSGMRRGGTALHTCCTLWQRCGNPGGSPQRGSAHELVGGAQRRVRLNGATGRRPRCSQRAKPARLLRRPPVDSLLGCSCARTRGWSAPRVIRRDAEQSPPTVADAGAPRTGRAVLGATVWVRPGRAAPGRPWVCRPGSDRRGPAGRSRRRRSLPWRLRPGRSGSHHRGRASGPRVRCRGPR